MIAHRGQHLVRTFRHVPNNSLTEFAAKLQQIFNISTKKQKKVIFA